MHAIATTHRANTLIVHTCTDLHVYEVTQLVYELHPAFCAAAPVTAQVREVSGVRWLNPASGGWVRERHEEFMEWRWPDDQQAIGKHPHMCCSTACDASVVDHHVCKPLAFDLNPDPLHWCASKWVRSSPLCRVLWLAPFWAGERQDDCSS